MINCKSANGVAVCKLQASDNLPSDDFQAIFQSLIQTDHTAQAPHSQPRVLSSPASALPVPAALVRGPTSVGGGVPGLICGLGRQVLILHFCCCAYKDLYLFLFPEFNYPKQNFHKDQGEPLKRPRSDHKQSWVPFLHWRLKCSKGNRLHRFDPFLKGGARSVKPRLDLNFLCWQDNTDDLIMQLVKPGRNLISQKERTGQTSPKMSAGAYISNLQFSPHLKDLNTLGQIHCGGQ